MIKIDREIPDTMSPDTHAMCEYVKSIKVDGKEIDNVFLYSISAGIVVYWTVLSRRLDGTPILSDKKEYIAGKVEVEMDWQRYEDDINRQSARYEAFKAQIDQDLKPKGFWKSLFG